MIINQPKARAYSSWDSEYGNVETVDGVHYIFLTSILVDNRSEGDVLSTLIRELLHILNPSWKENNVLQEEEAICEKYNIKPENALS